jgi:hypothetical protein
VVDRFTIPADSLIAGDNVIEVRIQDAATSQYWIRRLSGSSELALEFSKQVRSKLFIGPIGDACDPLGVVPLGPHFSERVAAYLVFCRLTDGLQDDPASGSEGPPLRARVLAIVDLRWSCRAGENTPLVGAVTPVAAIGGPEPLGLQGTAHPITVRDDLATDGTWAYVASGRPHPLAEIGFQIHRPRFRSDIWHHVAGSVHCETSASGDIRSRIEVHFEEATRFPSHRAYFYGGIDAPAFEQASSIVHQHALSNLWYLPEVRTLGAALSMASAQVASTSASADGGCDLVVPLAPDPLPPGYDWSALANDWCGQLAACGYDTSTCVDEYMDAVTAPIPTSPFPPPDDSTLSSPIESVTLSCRDSEEATSGTIHCAPEPTAAALGGVALALLHRLRWGRRAPAR